VRNAGQTDVWFLGTVEERALATQRTSIDGEPAPVQLAVTLQEREPRRSWPAPASSWTAPPPSARPTSAPGSCGSCSPESSC
jgi:hypothetical protein